MVTASVVTDVLAQLGEITNDVQFYKLFVLLVCVCQEHVQAVHSGERHSMFVQRYRELQSVARGQKMLAMTSLGPLSSFYDEVRGTMSSQQI